MPLCLVLKSPKNFLQNSVLNRKKVQRGGGGQWRKHASDKVIPQTLFQKAASLMFTHQASSDII